MTVKNETNKNYKRSQRGRSMVEMLGVLAIVGVLSAGGVYGYGVAVNKHRANTLLNEASKRAIIAIAQKSQGREVSNIEFGDFANNDLGFGTFGTSAVAVGTGTNKFGIQIGNITIYYYSILILLGVIIGLYLALREANKNGIGRSFISDLSFYVILFGIIGARIYYVVFNSFVLNRYFSLLIEVVPSSNVYGRRQQPAHSPRLPLLPPSILLIKHSPE